MCNLLAIYWNGVDSNTVHIMTKGCYTCRRRRIVCDNGFPTCRKCQNAGKECLGYQKPLVWVKGGVASRGKMMGLSFDNVACQGPSPSASGSQQMLPYGAVNGDQYQVHSDALVHYQNHPIEPPMYSLVDPVFQDLNKTSRFYVDMCKFKPSILAFCKSNSNSQPVQRPLSGSI